MSGKRIGKTSVRTTTNWNRLRTIRDREIRRGRKADPEVRSTDEKFWRKAEVVIPRRKETITIRLDADLLEWFRRHKGYQTRINAILRSYVRAQEHAASPVKQRDRRPAA